MCVTSSQSNEFFKKEDASSKNVLMQTGVLSMEPRVLYLKKNCRVGTL